MPPIATATADKGVGNKPRSCVLHALSTLFGCCTTQTTKLPADLGTEPNVLKSYMNIGMSSSYQRITI